MKRREWWLTGQRKIVCSSHEAAAAMNEVTDMVTPINQLRKALEGDDEYE